MRTRSSLAHFVAAWLALGSDASFAVTAFPGAQGFGAETPGGRGGQVLYVNTLDDHSDVQGCTPQDCTLREAIEYAGARFVLFKVGGTIVLDPLLGALVIEHPNITIAGQSAPGDGIEIRNDPDGADGLQTAHIHDSFPSILIDTHDVVVRHVRIRPGPLTPNPLCHVGPQSQCVANAVAAPPSAPGSTCVAATDVKAIQIENDASHIVLDHLSVSWGAYLVALLGSRHVTLQHSILSEGLNYIECDGVGASPEPYAGKAFMSGNSAIAQQGRIVGPYSLHHNLFAHNSARNPQITVKCLNPNDPLSCAADVRNNVIYNWKQPPLGFGAFSGNALGHHFGNMINNFIKVGSDGPALVHGLSMSDYVNSPKVGTDYFPGFLGIHHAGNRSFVSSGVSAPLSPLCGNYTAQGALQWCPNPAIYDPGAPYATPSVTTTSADQAYTDVLASAGASRRLEANGSATFNRDANDARVIATVVAGPGPNGGGIIDGFGEFPGFPSLSAGTPYADTDSDGMPDAWETAQCLDPNVASSAGDPDGDGYTNVEEFLNEEDATLDPDQDGIHVPCDVVCADGVDNDNDGQIDYPADPDCASAADTSEQSSCGLLGVEVVPVLLWAAFARSRRRVATVGSR